MLVAKILDQLLIKENVIEELAEDLDDVLRAGYRRIVLNFAQVERMSSQIVGVVVKAHRPRARRRGGCRRSAAPTRACRCVRPGGSEGSTLDSSR